MIPLQHLFPYQQDFLKLDLVEVNSLDVRDRIALLEDESDPSSVWTFFISSFLYHIGKVSGQYFTEDHTEEEVPSQLKVLFEYLKTKSLMFPEIYNKEGKYRYNPKSRVLIYSVSELRLVRDLKPKEGEKL